MTPEQQPPTTRPRSRLVLYIVLALLLLVVAGAATVIGYPILRVRAAKNRITAYCDAVPVGQRVDLDAMATDAKVDGLWVIGPEPDRAPGEPAPEDPATAPRRNLMVVDGWIFSRWCCDISTENGIVTKKRVSFLD